MITAQHLSGLFDAILTREQEAMTIARSRHLTLGVAFGDACIIAATPLAAAWYNLDDPAQLRGRWISQLHHPEDARLGRALSAARYLGVPVPTVYVSRIRQMPHAATFRPTLKQIRQLTVGTDTYWITRLFEPHDEAPLATQPAARTYLQMLTAPAAQQFLGALSAADVVHALQTAGLMDAEGQADVDGETRPRPAESTAPAAPGGHLGASQEPRPVRAPPPGHRPSLARPSRLRRLRQERGLTQHALAQRTGMSPVTISRLEQRPDVSHGTVDTVVRLAHALAVSSDVLLGLADPVPPAPC
jgi:DNA-binding XRE family transcriptional regulator